MERLGIVEFNQLEIEHIRLASHDLMCSISN
jgi:hypothetical protein